MTPEEGKRNDPCGDRSPVLCHNTCGYPLSSAFQWQVSPCNVGCLTTLLMAAQPAQSILPASVHRPLTAPRPHTSQPPPSVPEQVVWPSG